ncbi:MAG: VWA domain-containing protein [Blastocatellia bacterium]|nr:VWA domain-containing protein [Blastocatellia bacterium]
MKSLLRTDQYKPTMVGFCLSAAVALIVLVLGSVVWAQAGRNTSSARRTTILPLFVRFSEDTSKPPPLLGTPKQEEVEKILTRDKIELFDNGVFQKIESLAPDPSPARIVVVLDNSATLQTDVKKLAAIPAAFAPEIYEGDKVMVVGYDLKPEIITEFTDKPEDLQNTLSLLRKTDSPHLFEALDVVMEDVMRPLIGYSKRIIVLVSDGLDRDSKVKFDRILSTLQDENITVYAIQVKDRTRGALRKDVPKPVDCLEQLTVGTGGKIYSIDGDIKQAVKEICDEQRNERYQLTYYPEGINPINKRHLLLTSYDSSVVLRFKGSHPPHRY